MLKTHLPSFSLLFALVSCAHVDSTVESFGEKSIEKDRAVFFVTEGADLGAKHVISQCKKAAMQRGLRVVNEGCQECLLVRVSGEISSPQTRTGSYTEYEHVKTSGDIDVKHDGDAIHSKTSTVSYTETKSVPVTKYYSYNEFSRTLALKIYEGSSEVRSISVRSVGTGNSLAGVAFAMCCAAFRDFPADVSATDYSERPDSCDY